MGAERDQRGGYGRADSAGRDVDGPVTNFSVVTGPAYGQLIAQGGAEWVYEPGTNYFGLDSFTFRVDDGSLTSAVATVSLTVTTILGWTVSRSGWTTGV